MEWILAAVWANYKPFDEFFDLDVGKQSALIVAYQAHNKIEAVLANEQAKKGERASRKPKGK